MPPKCLKALAATNRAFRQIAQQRVIRVRMKPNHVCTPNKLAETVPQLVSGAWTQLQHLHINFHIGSPLTSANVRAIVQADWPAMERLDLQNILLTEDAVSLLVARPWPVLSGLNLSLTSLSTRACLKLLDGVWPQLRSLNLGWNHPDAIFFKQMVEGSKLLQLTELHLPSTWIDLAAVSELVQFKAHLQTFSFDRNNLSAPIMTLLAQADWASLEVLSICNCPGLDLEAVRSLARASWPRLSNLNIGKNQALGHAASMEVLSQANWPMLTALSLQGVQLSARAVKHLVRGDWPRLRTINLSWCGLTEAKSIQHASWPLLETLNVSHNGIHLQYLVKAHWPLLSHLDLGYNAIHAAGVQCLLGGCWPGLRHLVLTGNHLNMHAMQNLILGSWPDLVELEVSCSAIHHDVLVGLASLAHSTNWCKLRVLKIDNTHGLTESTLQTLLSGYNPLWRVLLGAAAPAGGKVLRTKDHICVDIMQYFYACPMLRSSPFPMLESLWLYDTMGTSVMVEFGKLAYCPHMSVTRLVAKSMSSAPSTRDMSNDNFK